jgi:hypothetical protein
VALAHAVKRNSTIYLLAEVNVVDLIDVALVHVASEQGTDDVVGSRDLEQVEHTQELLLSNVTVTRAVVVLELGLQVEPAAGNLVSVIFQDGSESTFLVGLSALEVLAAGKQSVSLSEGGHCGGGGFVDSLGGEGLVDGGAEVHVAEEPLGVAGLVPCGQSVVLCLGEVEVELGEDRVELVLGDAALAQLVIIVEELLNAHTLHNHGTAQAVLNVVGVAGNIDGLLQVAVVQHIDIVGGRIKEGRVDLLQLTTRVDRLGLGVLGRVAGEDVFGAVKVVAEIEVVDLSGGSTVAVLANDQIENALLTRHQSQLLHHPQELVLRDVKAAALIKVLEGGFEQNALRPDLVVQVGDGCEHELLLSIVENGAGLGLVDVVGSVDILVEDLVDVGHEASIVDEARLIGAAVASDKVLHFPCV